MYKNRFVQFFIILSTNLYRDCYARALVLQHRDKIEAIVVILLYFLTDDICASISNTILYLKSSIVQVGSRFAWQI